VTSGASSGGYTQVEMEGRCKPDLVAPHGLTSFSTPMVAAIAGRMLELADGHPHAEAARHAEVIKAVLMAGAEKPDGWKPAEGRPLDEHLGAGTVRADNSYGILAAPRQEPGDVKALGWDFRPLDTERFATYRVRIDEAVGPACITLVWHRRVIGRTIVDPDTGKGVWHNGARVADFDLRFARAAGEGDPGILARSTSEIDNVEHIWFDRLTPGQYVFQVSRKDSNDELWDYAVAWRFGDWRP
jgi:hypothetical protein